MPPEKLLELSMIIVSSQGMKIIHRDSLHSYALIMKNQGEIKKTMLLTIATKGKNRNM